MTLPKTIGESDLLAAARCVHALEFLLQALSAALGKAFKIPLKGISDAFSRQEGISVL
jgi:hypothetical protein